MLVPLGTQTHNEPKVTCILYLKEMKFITSSQQFNKDLRYNFINEWNKDLIVSEELEDEITRKPMIPNTDNKHSKQNL